MDAPSSETSIRQALDRGDLRRASELLVMHHADAVYATCRALVRERTLAEDLSQEAFTKAIAALRTFRGEAQVRTWLLSITRNTCLDHLRRTRGPIDERHALDVEVQPSEVAPPFEQLVLRGDVERSLSVLSETERAIVVLHHAHGVGYPELAASFGIAEGTLRMRMSRALLKMRSAVDEAPLAAPLERESRRRQAARPAAPRIPPQAAAPSRATPPSPVPSSTVPSRATPPSATPPTRERSWLDRLSAWWKGASEPVETVPTMAEPLWAMPDEVRARIVADLASSRIAFE